MIFALASCQKSSTKKEDPVVPVVPVSGTDTGLRYQATAICDYNYNDATLTSAGWTKTLEDDFNSGLTNWTLVSGGNESRNLQFYKESNVVTSNGIAQIVTKRESVTTTVNGASKNYDFTSGLMQSKGTFSANETTPKVRVVARIKLPRGFGLQPSFFSSGDDYPKSGQINMILANGSEPKIYATNYGFGTGSTNLVRDSYGFITTDADLTACYHVYETEWTKTSLNFYLDGKLVEQKVSGGYVPALFGKTHRLSFYVVISSDLIMRPQIQTGTMSIDWVKVFTSK
jgi:beta-glucanase (GH16 family)